MTAAIEAGMAQRLSGAPWQLAKCLTDTLTRCAREERRGVRIEIEGEIAALRRQLVQLFAERHGWRPSRAEFTPAVLTRRGFRDGSGRGLECWPYRLIDHPYFFRTPDRHAAALAAHLYDPLPDTQQQLRDWAAQRQLRIVFPTDFPSWWVPGRTTLCVYLPAEEARMSASG